MALTETEIKEFIKSDLTHMSDKDLISIINDYNDANKYEYFYFNTESNLEEICNNELYVYFEHLRYSDHYDQDEKFVRINGNGWLHSFDELEDEVDMDALVNFVFDHFDDYDSYLDETTNEIEIANDEDELEEEEEEEEE